MTSMQHWEWTFQGKAKKLDDLDLPMIGHTIGVGEDELHAFMDSEAAGVGWDDKGRPKILPEPHIFYRLLLERAPDKLRKALNANLAWKSWDPSKYDKTSDERYKRLHRMIDIDVDIALESCSWGLFQIMGFNYKKAGFSSVQEMVACFMEDEEEHLRAAVTFIVNSKLDDDLRAHRWSTIETVYNGGGQGGAYAIRMETSFYKWRKIKDTPYDPKIHGTTNYLPGRSKPAGGIMTEALKPVIRPPESTIIVPPIGGVPPVVVTIPAQATTPKQDREPVQVQPPTPKRPNLWDWFLSLFG